MIEYNDFRVVFSGDATFDTEDGALGNFDDVSTSVLTGSHHGANTHDSNHPTW